MTIQVNTEDIKAILYNHGLILAGLGKVCNAAKGEKAGWEHRVASAVGTEIDVLTQACKSMLATLDNIAHQNDLS